MEALINHINYRLDTLRHTAGVTCCKTEYSGDIVIPDTITCQDTVYRVTSILPYAFAGCKNITSVSLPDGLTHIEICAFKECSGLTAIDFPNTLKSIDTQAFYKCTALADVHIPDTIANIGNHAFGHTRWWDNQSRGAIYIGTHLWKYNGKMPKETHIEVREGTTDIEESAFQGCRNLTSITLPTSLVNIKNNAFTDCFGLTSIAIPKGVECIDNEAFAGCTSLKSITLPESLTCIGSGAFRHCTALADIALPCPCNRLAMKHLGSVLL